MHGFIEDAALWQSFERGEVPALYCFTGPAGQPHMELQLTSPALFNNMLVLLRDCDADSCTEHVVAAHIGGKDPLHQMQRVIERLYIPRATAKSWPEQLFLDWVAQATSFSCALSDTVHARQGNTVLFVPCDVRLADPAAAARQRELVQLLEAQVLRWSHQIQELVAWHRSGERYTAAVHGPAGEAALWRESSADLASLRHQLNSAGVGRVLGVLKAARSPHLPPFLSLCSSIEAEAEQAASNLAFLEVVEGACSELMLAQPTQLGHALAPVLDACRMVWALAPHYNTPDQLTGLLRQVGNAVLERCRSLLDVDSMLNGANLASAQLLLDQCCGAGEAWRAAYNQASERVQAAMPERPWAFNQASIFAHVEAFMQRCHDLQELCAAQRQFGFGQRFVAVVSGSKAPGVARALGEVKKAFAHQMQK